jgi:hypothetical protein
MNSGENDSSVESNHLRLGLARDLSAFIIRRLVMMIVIKKEKMRSGSIQVHLV